MAVVSLILVASPNAAVQVAAIDFTVAELKQLRLTERFNPKTGLPVYKGRFPLWQSSFQIPTLEEELQFIQGLNKSTGRNGALQITDLVKNAHALKLVVHPYTLRADDLPSPGPSFEEPCCIFFVEVGVDGVFTDFPDRASAFVQSLSAAARRQARRALRESCA